LPIGPSDQAAKETVAPADPALVREAVRGGAKPIARRSFFNDIPDKGLFLLFALAGFALTFATKLEGFTGLAPALAAVGVLFAYAFASSRLQWFKLHPDRLGDNCYYMGFLFTLASLSAALVNIETSSGDAHDALVEGLIGSFGFALFSTIGGILLRVIFMQFRREIEDVEEAVRNDLQEAARHLKDQLGDAVQNLEGFRTRTQQVMDEQFESAIAEFAKAAKALVEHVSASGATYAAANERLAQGAEKIGSDLARAAESIGTQIGAAGTSHREATEQLAARSGQMVEEIRRLVERVEQVDIPSDLLTRQVAAAREQITALVSAHREAAVQDMERQAIIERASTSLDRLLKRMSETPAFDGLEGTVERLRAGADAAAEAMQGASDKMGGLAASFVALVEQAQRDAAAMARARSSLDTDLAESTASLHKLQGGLAAVAETIVKQLGG
jgi:hypothetical protein